MTIDEFNKLQDDLIKKHKKVFTFIFPKDENNFQDFEVNPDAWYWLTIRRPNRNEYGLFFKHITENDEKTAIETILENCFVAGDSIIKDNDDYFFSILFNPETFEEISKMLVINQFHIDKENLTVYIRKEYDEVKNIEKDIVKNPDKYDVFKFRKPTRNDIIASTGNHMQSAATSLYKLCLSDNKNLILTNDDVFYTLVLGNKEQGSINKFLKPAKIMEIKKK